jgi:hypothetical protein
VNQHFLEDISGELCAVEFTQPVSTHMVGIVPSDMTEGMPNLTSDKPTQCLADHLTVPNVTVVLPNNHNAPPSLTNQAFSNLHGSFGSGFGVPFMFAKLPNLTQKMFQDPSVTGRMHIGMLLKFVCVLVHLRDLVIVSQISPAEILLVFYGFTKWA